MTPLRLSLIIIGLILVAAVYFWGAHAQRNRRRNRLLKRPDVRRRARWDEAGLDAPAVSPKSVDEVDYADTLTDLSTLLEEQRRPAGTGQDTQSILNPREAPPETPTVTVANEAKESKTMTPDRIIVVHIAAPEGQIYSGSQIRTAAEASGMHFGAMGVFHHYGIGQLKSGQSLFCLASMFEPGYFDLDTLDSFQTGGLSLFMRLPAPIESEIAFEFFLGTAQRLVKALGGGLLDERRRALNASGIERLRHLATSK